MRRKGRSDAIAKHLSEAVDLVRRRQNRVLRQAGDDRLIGTR
jgi:hypothetical protein